MSEIISPSYRDISKEFEHGFVGMTIDAVSREELEKVREDLVQRIQNAFTNQDREFLISVKGCSPKWNLLEIDGVEALPAVRWKLQNLEKLQNDKRTQLIERLTTVLSKRDAEEQ